MEFAEYLRPDDATQRKTFVQLGVTKAVLRIVEADSNAPTIDVDALRRTQAEFALDGVEIAVIEPVPPMEGVKQGLDSRDAELDRLESLIVAMGELGIPILCYNFMAVYGWLRTDLDVLGRGGARVTAFDLEAFEALGPHDRPLSTEQLWSNYEYFLERILPVAERAGVVLALHPDDPPLPSLRGVARIAYSPESIERAMSLSDSPSHRITFCQGTFAEMGVDIPATIRRMAPWIAFVHFRDVQGDASSFVETFQDEGRTDMAAAMRAYVEIGYRGPVRTDHVPTMHGETNDRPGYELLGRLYAIGYLRGLYEAASSPA